MNSFLFLFTYLVSQLTGAEIIHAGVFYLSLTSNFGAPECFFVLLPRYIIPYLLMSYVPLLIFWVALYIQCFQLLLRLLFYYYYFCKIRLTYIPRLLFFCVLFGVNITWVCPLVAVHFKQQWGKWTHIFAQIRNSGFRWCVWSRWDFG